jgi:diguanylate cyclase (GGDEF)-like protein/PAS domain S-box-containing protein
MPMTDPVHPLPAEPPLHPQLQRQLRRCGLQADGRAAPGGDPAVALAALLPRVSGSYADIEQERYLLQRSQDLASREMAALNAELRAERDGLERRVAERTAELELSQARLTSLLSLSADWIWEQDEQLCFTYFSEGIAATAGVRPQDLIGRRRMRGSEFDAEPEAVAAYEACIEARRAFRDFTYRYRRHDGEQRYIRISGEPVFDEGGNFRGYRGVGRDVTETRLAELKVHELARYDGLTGLPNRNMFLGELDRTIARARRQDMRFAVCFIDLDHFKTVNDRLGHAAGDELLRVMATRLRGAVRASDLVARLGGDEFVVLLEEGGGPGELDALGHKLLTAMGEPVVLQGCTFLVTGSVGLSMFPQDGADAATLLKNADAAMYQAKGRGKNNVQFYTAELADIAARQFELESELRLALAREELLLHYQPRFDVRTGALLGLEALVRWRHPKRGLVPPDEFIPLAEQRGLIVPLGRWVIRAACRQLRDWRAAGLAPPPVAVNLSARQFADDALVGDFQEAMARHGVLAHELEVELTESVLMADPERANEVLQQLCRMGLKIAIDDFGTGYSSLSYLQRFPARTVKIDRSFIRKLPDSSADTAITTAVISMAHSLGLTVVAEGVETPQQLQQLRELGCDEAQGFLLGRPVEAAVLAAALPTAAPTADAA